VTPAKYLVFGFGSASGPQPIAAVIAAQFTPLPPNPAERKDKTPPTVTIAFTGAS